MDWLTGIEILVGLMLVAISVGLILVFVRRRSLSLTHAVYDAELGRDGKKWVTGLLRLEEDELAWYRIMSLSFRPYLRLNRTSVELVSRREPDPSEQAAMFTGHRVIRLRGVTHTGESDEWNFGLSRGSEMGVMSWMEGAPPGGPDYLARA